MRHDEYKREFTPPRKYPYGFMDWMNSFWQAYRKIGYVSKDSDPVNLGGLDMDAFLHYFLYGFSPREAIKSELENL